jgi:hypothetical protein
LGIANTRLNLEYVEELLWELDFGLKHVISLWEIPEFQFFEEQMLIPGVIKQRCFFPFIPQVINKGLKCWTVPVDEDCVAVFHSLERI